MSVKKIIGYCIIAIMYTIEAYYSFTTLDLQSFLVLLGLLSTSIGLIVLLAWLFSD